MNSNGEIRNIIDLYEKFFLVFRMLSNYYFRIFLKAKVANILSRGPQIINKKLITGNGQNGQIRILLLNKL